MKDAAKCIAFSEIATVYNGNSISKKEKQEKYIGLDEGTSYIATKDVGFDHSIDYENGVLIPDSESSEFKIAPKNSVLICAEGGSAGRKVAHTDRDVHFGNKLFALVPMDRVRSKYLYYYTLSNEFFAQFSELKAGLIGGVSLKKFKSILIPLFDLDYQSYVIDFLNEAFSNINDAIANTKKNLGNIEELYKSYLNKFYQIPQDSVGQKWEVRKLKELCEKITDGVHKKPTYVDNGIPFIKINNLTSGPGISFDGVSYISEKDHKEFTKRTNPEKGDILITKDGTIGVVRIIDTDVEFSIFVSVALIKPEDKKLSPYLKYALESPLIQDKMNPQGAALKHIYLKDLREYSIPLAPEPERTQIVDTLDTLSDEIQRLELIYNQKLAALKELKQSLLQKAFSGELSAATEKEVEEAVA
ncbi:restriction endonuclease subunit S [Thiohalophilus sp.]|uniref:restriction endonuclease subunit S n=1 Tax=Thiohalophilus sp. TaxID=3028392 RepID=UPI002ACE7DA8|nr:restriction endonuclease subunit S [Thiohalophilus sp.]MDZ7662516.1 restriction endonuclease subunit S [Thiohalophilus sp.]